MKIFEIWVEGYEATGQRDTARFLGTNEGETFEDACREMKELMPEMGIEENEHGEFDIWGCRLFDNEAEARMTFG